MQGPLRGCQRNLQLGEHFFLHHTDIRPSVNLELHRYAVHHECHPPLAHTFLLRVMNSSKENTIAFVRNNFSHRLRGSATPLEVPNSLMGVYAMWVYHIAYKPSGGCEAYHLPFHYPLVFSCLGCGNQPLLSLHCFPVAGWALTTVCCFLTATAFPRVSVTSIWSFTDRFVSLSPTIIWSLIISSRR